MSLLVIGETAGRLNEGTRATAPKIRWTAMISMRNRLAHGYETVDYRLVWQIVRKNLPDLKSEVERLLAG